jgi:hypothetical protein
MPWLTSLDITITTVRIRGADDDIRSNVRKGLDIVEATNYRSGCSLIQREIDAADTEELAELKFGLVDKESLKRSIEAFTPYSQSLVQWVNRLRRLIFPIDKP